jgi:O-acetyl-ADP-ribose deacetylase (regulator of RNase III)
LGKHSSGKERFFMNVLRIGEAEIRLKQGDITREEADAIVNAANSGLLGGGGVDGAIHRAGGPAIMEECREIRAHQGGCPTGEAVVTGAGNLRARYVIHAVGPVWKGGGSGEENLLRSAYRNSLRRATERNLRTVAFPSISTGAYGYPVEQAAQAALSEVRRFLQEEDHSLREVRFVLFDESTYRAYEEALNRLKG